MNLGQVLELHLGMAGKKLGVHFATPVFDGASEQDIAAWYKGAGALYWQHLPESDGSWLARILW